MSGGGLDKPKGRSQSFRNRVTVLVVGVVVGTLAVLYYVALGSASAPGIAGALCTIGFLAIAFLGWEYLMKPGYGLHARMRSPQEPAEGDRPEERQSP